VTYSERMTNLKELLDSQHEWPGNYTFKFVVPGNKSGELRQVVAAEESHSRQSKSGKYTSMTFEIACQSSDDVISIYQKVSKIEGIVTL
jgi:putative lipoic acid-binding regulatory protein